jgi:hypothetical protein
VAAEFRVPDAAGDFDEAVPFLHGAAAEVGDDEAAAAADMGFEVFPQRLRGGQAF